MNIGQFSEDHPGEFIMTMMEIEGGLLALDATLNYLAMLMHRGVL